MKHYYAAIFVPQGEGLSGYTLRFPDLPGCFTLGENVAECMEMAQDALGVMFADLDEKDYPAPVTPAEIDLSTYPQGSFATFVCFDKELYDATIKKNTRQAILTADNPIRELLNRRRMKIKDLSDDLNCPYRTAQDWALGKSKPPQWVLPLILDKILD